MINTDFVIPAQAARLSQPPKGPLTNPGLGQHLESFGPVRAAQNFQVQLAKRPQLLCPLNQATEIATIGADDLHAAIHRDQQLDQAPGGIPILQSNLLQENEYGREERRIPN